MGKRVVHDFDESLRKSHKAADLPLWRAVYAKAFRDFKEMVDHREDGWHQRDGIDRSITLAQGKQLYIDEKARYEDYGDILLEYVSNDQAKTPGWVCKPLRCDYIAYAILPAGKCYLFPVLQLQAAWAKMGEIWLQEARATPAKHIGEGPRGVIYRGIRRAQNNGYWTLNVNVMPKELFDQMTGELVIRFDPPREERTRQAEMF